MKTGNTLRMARNSLLCFFMALAAGFLVACGGGGGGGGGVSSNGTFHASDWVVGLDYTYLDNGETGKTGEKGAFPLRSDQSVVFSIGQVTLGTLSSVSDASEDFITPTRIGDELRAVDVEQLLIALDSDGDNGTIALDENSATDAMVVMSVIAASNIDSERTLPVGNDDISVAVQRVIPTEDVAGGLLSNTNNCAFSGAFEGTWTDSDGFTGETALVLLAFNDQKLDQVANPLGAVRGVGMSLSHIVGENNARPSGALYFNLWREGGGPQSNVVDFGGDAGELAIGLRGFPVVTPIETEDGKTITLTVESYDRMTYTSAEETGEYRRVANGDRDSDYRIVGFYSDEDNGDGEAEIGIYAFSANKGGGNVRPYVGWLSSPITGDDSSSVYSNIGEGGLSSLIDYTGTPDDGEMTLTERDGSDEFTFTFESDGTYAYSADGTDLVGGWCGL